MAEGGTLRTQSTVQPDQGTDSWARGLDWC